MEEIKDESSQEQRVERITTETVSNEPLAGVNFKFPIISSPEQYRNATEEEKVLHCATTIVLQVIKENKKSITIAEQEQLMERTVRQVRAERQNLFSTLNEAEQELKMLKWNNILPRSITNVQQRRVAGRRTTVTQNSIGGFRGLYILTFGNFVLAKNSNWIYRPTQDQMQKIVNRWMKKKPCEEAAIDLRNSLKMSALERAKLSPPFEEELVESEAMKVFKKNLLDQINELRVTV